jgi:hypothetical protein
LILAFCLGSIKTGEILDEMGDGKLLKNDSASWTYYLKLGKREMLKVQEEK